MHFLEPRNLLPRFLELVKFIPALFGTSRIYSRAFWHQLHFFPRFLTPVVFLPRILTPLTFLPAFLALVTFIPHFLATFTSIPALFGLSHISLSALFGTGKIYSRVFWHLWHDLLKCFSPLGTSCMLWLCKLSHLGRVVRKPVNANLGLKVNPSINFSSIKMFSTLMFCVVWDYSSSKLKEKQYKQKTSPKRYKMEPKFSLILG